MEKEGVLSGVAILVSRVFISHWAHCSVHRTASALQRVLQQGNEEVDQSNRVRLLAYVSGLVNQELLLRKSIWSL